MKVESGRLGRRIQWTLSERDDVDKIRSALESNKTALEITLSIGTISLLTRSMEKANDQGHNLAVKVQQTQSMSTSTARIEHKLDDLTTLQKDSTRLDAINVELIALRKQLGILSSNAMRNQNMSVFAGQARSYVSDMIKPVANSLSEASQASTGSLLRIRPIIPSHTNAPSISGNAPGIQQGLNLESCPTCTGSVVNKQQKYAIQTSQTEQSVYKTQLFQNRDDLLKRNEQLQKDIRLIRLDASRCEREMNEAMEVIIREHSKTITEKDAIIRNLLDELQKPSPQPDVVSPSPPLKDEDRDVLLIKLIEATSPDVKAANRTELAELVELTYKRVANIPIVACFANSNSYSKSKLDYMMDILVGRVSGHDDMQTLKSLHLCDYLLLNGSGLFGQWVRDNVDVFERIYTRWYNNDTGGQVRQAARDFVALAVDQDRLGFLRAAKKTK